MYVIHPRTYCRVAVLVQQPSHTHGPGTRCVHGFMQGSVSLLTVSSGVRVANRLNNKRLTQVMAVALACIAPLVAFKPGTEAGTVEQKAEQQGDTSSSSRESTASAPEWVVKGLAATGMPQHWQDRLASDSVEGVCGLPPRRAPEVTLRGEEFTPPNSVPKAATSTNGSTVREACAQAHETARASSLCMQ